MEKNPKDLNVLDKGKDTDEKNRSQSGGINKSDDAAKSGQKTPEVKPTKATPDLTRR